MGIRGAVTEDWKSISALLDQLGYPDTERFIKDKLNRMLAHPDEEILVYEWDGVVVAFVSLHFIPQIGLGGDIARISYFAVDEPVRSKASAKRSKNTVSKSPEDGAATGSRSTAMLGAWTPTDFMSGRGTKNHRSIL